MAANLADSTEENLADLDWVAANSVDLDLAVENLADLTEANLADLESEEASSTDSDLAAANLAALARDSRIFTKSRM